MTVMGFGLKPSPPGHSVLYSAVTQNTPHHIKQKQRHTHQPGLFHWRIWQCSWSGARKNISGHRLVRAQWATCDCRYSESQSVCSCHRRKHFKLHESNQWVIPCNVLKPSAGNFQVGCTKQSHLYQQQQSPKTLNGWQERRHVCCQSS